MVKRPAGNFSVPASEDSKVASGGTATKAFATRDSVFQVSALGGLTDIPNQKMDSLTCLFSAETLTNFIRIITVITTFSVRPAVTQAFTDPFSAKAATATAGKKTDSTGS